MQSISSGQTMGFLNALMGDGDANQIDPAHAHDHVSSERAGMLEYRRSYFTCTQHDHKRYDFDGRLIAGWGNARTPSQPLITGERVGWYVSLKERRPSTPYRLGKSIVSAFTRFVFGEFRFPQFQVKGDQDAQDFANEIVKQANLKVHAILARNMGGSCGSVGWSWCITNGKPIVTIHNPKDIAVHEWADETNWIPAHVSEITLVSKDAYDPTKKMVVKKWFWNRQDWLPDADIFFKECPYEQGKEPYWEPDYERSVVHRDGICHFVWTQNKADPDMDSLPDYDGAYEKMDEIDITYSTISRGTRVNLDPTVVLKMDPQLIKHQGLRKGSDNALFVGESGDARYMEMSGSGINVALNVFQSQKATALEECNCIIVDPNVIAAQGMSSVTLKAIYAPMLSECDLYRVQYGAAVLRIVKDILTVCQRRYAKNEMAVVTDDDGKEAMVEIQEVLQFPLKTKMVARRNENGEFIGEEEVLVPHHPGVSNDVELVWGDYFIPTPDDQQKAVTIGNMASGGTPTLSQESATRYVAKTLGINPNDEWKRVEAAAKQKKAEQSNMFGDPGFMGGSVGEGEELPMGALPRKPTSNVFTQGDEEPKKE